LFDVVGLHRLPADELTATRRGHLRARDAVVSDMTSEFDDDDDDDDHDDVGDF